jgi:uncharacterized protein (DUF488 family)
VYTIGYGSMTPAKLNGIAQALGAAVVDIRFRAASQRTEWNYSAMKRFFGDRYVHLPTLGNKAYKTGGMEIADYARGKAAIEQMEQPVILLCACYAPGGCHRTVVGELLRRDGYTVTELTKHALERLLAAALSTPPTSPTTTRDDDASHNAAGQLSLWET